MESERAPDAAMGKNRPALFRGRHFADEIIILRVRWYLRFSLSYRDLEELMAEWNLMEDHTTLWRWMQRHAPEQNRRVRREFASDGPVLALRMRPTSGSQDGGCICIGGGFGRRTIDFCLSPTRDLVAAKTFFRKCLAGTHLVRPRVINVDGNLFVSESCATAQGGAGRACRLDVDSLRIRLMNGCS